ncbi:MAG: tRNA (adenosine(37)-N6)-threonylcarbamoyltransferase complex ATPase subunit type 1 TsaE [Bacteroidota bacterium]
MEKYTIDSVEGLPFVASKILKHINKPRVVLLQGDLGAGKTLLIKEICSQLNVVDTVNSPTFSIVNEYSTETGDTVFHIDLYRVENEAELLDIGFEEYIFSSNFCFIEWPEKAGSLIPREMMKVTIEKLSETRREIIIFPEQL